MKTMPTIFVLAILNACSVSENARVAGSEPDPDSGDNTGSVSPTPTLEPSESSVPIEKGLVASPENYSFNLDHIVRKLEVSLKLENTGEKAISKIQLVESDEIKINPVWKVTQKPMLESFVQDRYHLMITPKTGSRSSSIKFTYEVDGVAKELVVTYTWKESNILPTAGVPTDIKLHQFGLNKVYYSFVRDERKVELYELDQGLCTGTLKATLNHESQIYRYDIQKVGSKFSAVTITQNGLPKQFLVDPLPAGAAIVETRTISASNWAIYMFHDISYSAAGEMVVGFNDLVAKLKPDFTADRNFGEGGRLSVGAMRIDRSMNYLHVLGNRILVIALSREVVSPIKTDSVYRTQLINLATGAIESPWTNLAEFNSGNVRFGFNQDQSLHVLNEKELTVFSPNLIKAFSVKADANEELSAVSSRIDSKMVVLAGRSGSFDEREVRTMSLIDAAGTKTPYLKVGGVQYGNILLTEKGAITYGDGNRVTCLVK